MPYQGQNQNQRYRNNGYQGNRNNRPRNNGNGNNRPQNNGNQNNGSQNNGTQNNAYRVSALVSNQAVVKGLAVIIAMSVMFGFYVGHSVFKPKPVESVVFCEESGGLLGKMTCE